MSSMDAMQAGAMDFKKKAGPILNLVNGLYLAPWFMANEFRENSQEERRLEMRLVMIPKNRRSLDLNRKYSSDGAGSRDQRFPI